MNLALGERAFELSLFGKGEEGSGGPFSFRTLGPGGRRFSGRQPAFNLLHAGDGGLNTFGQGLNEAGLIIRHADG